MRTIKVNKSVTINFDSKLTKKQEYITTKLVSEHGMSDAIEYLNTLSGNGRGRIFEARSVWRELLKNQKTDILSEKNAGSVLAVLNRMIDPNTSKRPTDAMLGEWIGVEIECFIPCDAETTHDCNCSFDESGNLTDECACCLDDCSCEPNTDETVEAFKKQVVQRRIRNINVKYDGSIRPADGYAAMEVCVLFTRKNDGNLKALCKLLNDVGAKVNKSCGLHIHLDQRDLITSDSGRMITQRAKRLGNALPLLLQMVPKSRRDNSYCRPVIGPRRGGRYYAVNMTAVRKYGTIEVRLHSGTTDYQKIANWIELCYSISRARKMSKRADTFEELFQRAEINPTLATYIRNRVYHFNGMSVPESAQDMDSTETTETVAA